MNAKIHKTVSAWPWILLITLLVGDLLFYTWCRVQSVNAGYEIRAAEEEGRRLDAVRNSLVVELTRLKSPDRIYKIAIDRLGLVMPGPEQTVVIK